MNEDKIKQLITSFNRNRIKAEYFSSKNKFMGFLSNNLELGISVGIGDSKTLEELGVYSILRSSGVHFLDK